MNLFPEDPISKLPDPALKWKEYRTEITVTPPWQGISPLPWRSCGASNNGCSCGLIWSLPQDDTVATSSYNNGNKYSECCIPFEQSVKNRHYIVHACNAYPKLIEFVKKSKEMVDHEDMGSKQDLIDKIDAFLKEFGE